MNTSRDWDLVIAAHQLKIARYELIPEADRNWEIRGSIQYHLHAIKACLRLRNKQEDAPPKAA